jgi:hypothetical protein
VKRLLGVVLSCCLLAACGPAGEKEPNDDFSNATPAKAGRIEASLSAAGDADFYRLDNDSEPAALSAHISGIRDADFVLSVYDKDRRELKRVDETSVGGDEDLADIGLKLGASYVKIANKNAKFANPQQKYLLELRIQRGPGRELEPNDTAQTASKLDLPGVTRGHYFPSRNLLSDDTDYLEADWYKLEVPQEGLFLLNIDAGEVEKVDPLLEIYDANGYKLKEASGEGAGRGVSVKNFGVRGPAAYTMRLTARNRAANADKPYEILTELIPYQGKNEFEPNDQRVDATPFSGDSIAGTAAPEGDSDWYKVTVNDDQKMLLRASVTGVDGLDLAFTFADALGNPIVVSDNMGKGQPETLTGFGVVKGDYFLIVAEKTGRKANKDQSYTLTKTLVPWQPGLEYEVNDSTAAAQQLKVGEAVDGYFGWKGDADYYEFNVYNKGVVIFELAGVLNVLPTVTLFDQEGTELQSWSAAKPGESLMFERDLEPGTYALKLKAAKDEQNNVRDKYSVRLKIK